MIIHPENMMIERRLEQGGRCQLYMKKSGDLEVKVVKGISVVAIEDIKLEKVASVKVGEKAGIDLSGNKMFMVDGQDAK